ncbi:MAG: histidine kinase N-terminal 7TM domain-containing protein [Alkalispirochaetaceae bacterium]
MAEYQLSPLAWILFIASAFALYLAVYLFRNREARGSHWFFWTVLSLFVWTSAYGLELAATDRDSMLFWANLQFFGIGAAPLLWYATVNTILGKNAISTPMLLLLIPVPLITVVLAFSGVLPGLFRGSPEVLRIRGATVLRADYGPWHNLVFVPYQYLLYALSLLQILRKGAKAMEALRARYISLASAMALPMLGGLLYVLGIGAFTLVNPTPFLLLVSFGIVNRTLRRHRILDVVVVAKDILLDQLPEAVYVVNSEGEILYANRAANTFAVGEGNSVEGENFGEAMDEYPELLLLALGSETEDASFRVSRNQSERFYLAKARPLYGLDGKPFGRTITLSEITDAGSGKRRSGLRVVPPSA